MTLTPFFPAWKTWAAFRAHLMGRKTLLVEAGVSSCTEEGECGSFHALKAEEFPLMFKRFLNKSLFIYKRTKS